MTLKKLRNLIEKYNIPEDVLLLSDSGWECGATDMDGVYYNEQKNTIVFTQSCSEYEDYSEKKEWIPLLEINR